MRRRSAHRANCAPSFGVQRFWAAGGRIAVAANASPLASAWRECDEEQTAASAGKRAYGQSPNCCNQIGVAIEKGFHD